MGSWAQRWNTVLLLEEQWESTQHRLVVNYEFALAVVGCQPENAHGRTCTCQAHPSTLNLWDFKVDSVFQEVLLWNLLFFD